MGRSTGKVDKQILTTVIEELESSTTFGSLGDLWKAVALQYNTRMSTSVSPITIYAKVREYDITTKTINGRKKSISVDIQQLQGIIQEVENNGVPSNRNALFTLVTKILTDRTNIVINPSTVAALAKKRGLKINTPMGKCGRFTADRASRGIKVCRKDKFLENTRAQEVFKFLKRTFPERFQPIVRKIIDGSMKAAVQAKCLECADFQTSEVRLCPVECPLWAFRPYQGNAKDYVDTDNAQDIQDIQDI